MARRPPKTKVDDSADDSPKPEPFSAVIALLSKLRDPPKLDASTKCDRFALAQLVCERSDDFTLHEAVGALMELLLEPAFDRVKTYILRERYFLDPNVLADDVVARIWSEQHSRRRESSMSAWLDGAVIRSARANLGDSSSVVPPTTPLSSPKDRIANALGRIVNTLDARMRFVAWRLFIDGRSFQRVAEESQIPFEHLEAYFMELATRAMRIAGITADGTHENTDSSYWSSENGPPDPPQREREEGTDE